MSGYFATCPHCGKRMFVSYKILTDGTSGHHCKQAKKEMADEAVDRRCANRGTNPTGY